MGLAFDEELAFAEIEILTGPPYLGRHGGSPEGHAAGDYVAQRFAEYGLRPAGMEGTFFQPFSIVYTTLSETPLLIVTAPDGTTHQYRFRQDFSTTVARYTGDGEAEGPVVWVSDCTHDDFDGVDAVGKVVLCRNSRQERGGQGRPLPQ